MFIMSYCRFCNFSLQFVTFQKHPIKLIFESTITAIFKKGSRSNVGNYRLVSLTCQCHVAYEKYGLISGISAAYGFSPSHITGISRKLSTVGQGRSQKLHVGGPGAACQRRLPARHTPHPSPSAPAPLGIHSKIFKRF